MRTKTPIDILPANRGEINHEPPKIFSKYNFQSFIFYIPIVANTFHLILREPCATRAKPIVAPTILCEPDTGKLKNVATNNQIQQPRETIYYKNLNI
jgi:hypothetical protein